MAKKHDINLDFVRAVAALFIVFSHFFDNTGLYEFDTAFPIKLASVGLRMIVGTCVAMFIMLTGYLCSEKSSRRATIWAFCASISPFSCAVPLPFSRAFSSCMSRLVCTG